MPLLLALVDHEGDTQAQLSRRLHIKAPTVTVMIDKIERIGLVERRQDPKDKRKLRIYLTEAGIAVTAEARAAAHEITSAMIKDISEEELAVFRTVIGRMKQNLDAVCAVETEPPRAQRKSRECPAPIDF